MAHKQSPSPSRNVASYFNKAENFEINGGDFSNVQGDQTHFTYTNGPVQMDGYDNSVTFVDGSYYNGPNDSITNEAGGDVNITGQGNNCKVVMDEPPSYSRGGTPQRAFTSPPERSPPGNYQRQDGGITNRAGGNVNVVGQGRGTSVRIGSQSPQHITPNGSYSFIPEYDYRHRYPPPHPYPSQFQHYYPQSPQQTMFNPSIPSSPPTPFDWTGYPSDRGDGFPAPTSTFNFCPQYTQPNIPPYSGVFSTPPTAFQPSASAQFPPTGQFSGNYQYESANIGWPRAAPYAAPMPTYASEPVPPVVLARSAPETPAPTPPTAFTKATSASQSVTMAHPVPVAVTKEESSNDTPQSLPSSPMTPSRANDIPHIVYPREDTQRQAVTTLLSVPSPLAEAMNPEPAASPAMAPSSAPPPSTPDGLSLLPSPVSGNGNMVSASNTSASTIMDKNVKIIEAPIQEEVNAPPKIKKCRGLLSRFIKKFKKVKRESQI